MHYERANTRTCFIKKFTLVGQQCHDDAHLPVADSDRDSDDYQLLVCANQLLVTSQNHVIKSYSRPGLCIIVSSSKD